MILATDPDCDRLGVAAPRSTDSKRTVGDVHWQPDRRATVRVCPGGSEEGRALVARSLRREDAGHHRDDSPHRRRLRRQDVWRSASGFQVDRPGDRRVRSRAVRVWLRRVARVSGRGARARQGRGGGVDADGRTGRTSPRPPARRCTRSSTRLFWQYGYHAERQLSLTMPGSQGMRDMHTIMGKFRATPPRLDRGAKSDARVRLSVAHRNIGRGSRRNRWPVRREIW